MRARELDVSIYRVFYFNFPRRIFQKLRLIQRNGLIIQKLY